ncbi:MAG: glycerophosphodiester phosphodiesterase, partial [Planctomycetales bacterium]
PSMESRVLDCLRSTETSPEDVVFLAFDRTIAANLACSEPRAPSIWLVDDPPRSDDERQAMLRDAGRASVSGLGFSTRHASRELVTLARENGLSVYVWTANEQAEIEAMVSLGIDALITDYPDRARAVIEDSS